MGASQKKPAGMVTVADGIDFGTRNPFAALLLRSVGHLLAGELYERGKPVGLFRPPAPPRRLDLRPVGQERASGEKGGPQHPRRDQRRGLRHQPGHPLAALRPAKRIDNEAMWTRII